MKLPEKIEIDLNVFRQLFENLTPTHKFTFGLVQFMVAWGVICPALVSAKSSFLVIIGLALAVGSVLLLYRLTEQFLLEIGKNILGEKKDDAPKE